MDRSLRPDSCSFDMIPMGIFFWDFSLSNDSKYFPGKDVFLIAWEINNEFRQLLFTQLGHE